MANTKGQIFGINGPVVKVKGSDSFERQKWYMSVMKNLSAKLSA